VPPLPLRSAWRARRRKADTSLHRSRCRSEFLQGRQRRTRYRPAVKPVGPASRFSCSPKATSPNDDRPPHEDPHSSPGSEVGFVKGFSGQARVAAPASNVLALCIADHRADARTRLPSRQFTSGMAMRQRAARLGSFQWHPHLRPKRRALGTYTATGRRLAWRAKNPNRYQSKDEKVGGRGAETSARSCFALC